MLIVDLIAGAVIAGAVVWGFAGGLERMLPVAGFGVGVVLGMRVPAIFGGDLHSEFSLVAALPSALVLGGLLAALVERFGPAIGQHRGIRGTPSAVAGALLAGAVGAVVVWALGPFATEVTSLRDPVEGSRVLARLNSVMAPAGPKQAKQAPPLLNSFPIALGPAPDIPPADPAAEKDPEVLAAQGSVVKIGVFSCGHGEQGSGWVAADGIVVTNAHVAASADTITVRLRGTGPARVGIAIWFDPVNDLALLRVPGLRGVPALPIVRSPKVGTSGAALGFPRAIRAVRRARLGPTTRNRRGKMGGHLPGPRFPRELKGRLVTTFRGSPEPGSSGGPVVDTRGRVLTTVFGGLSATASALGVPNRFVIRALRRAGPPVSTGGCVKDSNRSH